METEAPTQGGQDDVGPGLKERRDAMGKRLSITKGSFSENDMYRHVYKDSEPITLGPQPPGTSVFFDETLCEIVIVRNGNDVEAIPYPDHNESVGASPGSVRVSIPNKGPVNTCPRFSLDRRFLAVLRSNTSVDFIQVRSPNHASEFTLQVKGGSKEQVRIVDFYFPSMNDFFVVTNHSLEFYTFSSSKNIFKMSKSFSLPVTWCLYLHQSRVLLIASGTTGAPIQPFLFQNGSVVKMAKFELELAGRAPAPVTRADVHMSFMYGKLYCIHVRTDSDGSSKVLLYHISRDVVLLKATIPLKLPRGKTNRRFEVNVVDNLLLVHAADLGLTYIFDIKESTLHPIASPLPISETNPDGDLPAPPPAKKEESSAKGKEAAGGEEEDGKEENGKEEDGKEEDGKEAEVSRLERGPRTFPPPQRYPDDVSFYVPDIVFNAKASTAWRLRLNLNHIALSYTDRKRLLAFLLKRANSKVLILATLRAMVRERENLDVIGHIFDMLNEVCWLGVQERIQMEEEERSRKNEKDNGLFNYFSSNKADNGTSIFPRSPRDGNEQGPGRSWGGWFRRGDGGDDGAVTSGGNKKGRGGGKRSPPVDGTRNTSSKSVWKRERTWSQSQRAVPVQTTNDGYVVIDQADMYTYVLAPLEEEKTLEFRFITAVLIEYIRSLNFHHLPVQHYLHELVINHLVQNKKYHQLHQFLQYHVVSDSLPVAYQLLSLDSVYPPAYQLALDMLKRLSTHEEIVEVLLSRGQLLAALRYIRTHQVRAVSAKRFLEVAYEKDSSLFYTVYTFFEQRNQYLRGSPQFRPEDGCEVYVRHFKELFSTPARKGTGTR